MLHSVPSLLTLAFPALVILGAVSDLVSYRIPNAISLALLAAFAVAASVAVAAGLPLAVVGVSLAVGAGALVAGIAMFAVRWIGGGDAKLLAAAALWVGWPGLPTFLAATCLAGGALALVLLALRSVALRPLLGDGPAWMVRLAEPGESVPYGVAIAVGALAAFPASPLVGGASGF